MKFKCPWVFCGAEIDSREFRFKLGQGMIGKCPTCKRKIILVRGVATDRKRLTGSQMRKVKRQIYQKVRNTKK